MRCGNSNNVVGCHYTGVRRLAYGGGFGQKVHDFLTAGIIVVKGQGVVDALPKLVPRRVATSEVDVAHPAVSTQNGGCNASERKERP